MGQRNFQFGVPCPKCSTFNPQDRTTCHACGAELIADSDLPDMLPWPTLSSPPPPVMQAPLLRPGWAIGYMGYLLVSIAFGSVALWMMVTQPEDWATETVTLTAWNMICITFALVVLTLATLIGVFRRVAWGYDTIIALHMIMIVVWGFLWWHTSNSAEELAGFQLLSMLGATINTLLVIGLKNAKNYFNR